MQTKNITIQGKEYKLRVGFGVMMEFESQFNKSISGIRQTKEIASLLYTTLKYNNEGFNMDFKAFVDEILDENPDLIGELMELLFTKEQNSTDKKK